MTTHANFIGHEWQAAKSGATDPVLNPADGEALAHVPSSDREDINAAVVAAQKGFAGWSRSTPRERSEALLKMADVLEANLDELKRIEMQNAGKPVSMIEFEMDASIDSLRFFAAGARCMAGSPAAEYLDSEHTSMLRRDPLGVIGSIAPWNYPLTMAVWKFGPAIAAGNTVVLKPSELTPLSMLRFAELTKDILPAGVLNVVCGTGESAGAALVAHPDVAMVSLTGGVATGQNIARSAADSLKRVHLELGGKAPVVVFNDADIDAVVEGVREGGFYNSGQDCTAACRLIAHDSMHDDLVDGLRASIGSLPCGDPTDENSEIGPVISKHHQKRIAGMVDRATSAGAEALVGGNARDGVGNYFEPSLIVGVDQADEIVQREVFGPVVTVQKCKDEAEAIEMANAVDYGLAASVWTKDVGKAMSASRDLNFGTVWVNSHLSLVSEMPHGGFKKSGYGKDMSVYAIEHYTELKHVMIKH